jgi:hypothetical protein
MRATIAIDEEPVDELMRVEGDVSRSEAIRRAVQDYLQRKRLDEFMRLAGSRLVCATDPRFEQIPGLRLCVPCRPDHRWGVRASSAPGSATGADPIAAAASDPSYRAPSA